MTAPKTYVDNVLVNWGERWDWSPRGQKARIRRSRTGLALLALARPPRPAMSAARARETLQAIARKAPEVVVKVTGGAKTLQHLRAHLSYIGRVGKGDELEIEDDRGNAYKGREGIDALEELWAHGGQALPAESPHREALNVVVSMPAGTDCRIVLEAGRAFAEAFFGTNHPYNLVLHDVYTDPDPEPSPHPHVHIVVKVRGHDGVRLNPRKADLQEWREAFARELRDRGVEAVATRRRTRLRREKGEPIAARKITERHARSGSARPVRPARAVSSGAAERARANAQALIADYATVARALAESEQPTDRRLATQLGARVLEAATASGLVDELRRRDRGPVKDR